MELRYATFLLGWIVAPVLVLGQQTPLTVLPNDHPAVGDTVVIEFNVPVPPKTKISWRNNSGMDFSTQTTDQRSVKFVPSSPGTTVIIFCDVSIPDGSQAHYQTTLSVARTAPQAAQPSRATQNAAPIHHAGDLLLANMAYMVSSGWMGDAVQENGGAATLDAGYNQGCRPGSTSCIHVDYAPSNGKVGWAAFAWQRVIDDSGNGANWGQSPGADFSKGGYRSMRVYARGLPDAGGIYPKVQFKSGGNVNPTYKENPASYAAAGPFVQLTGQFQDYCVSLENKNLTNTVSPFTVVMTKAGNARTVDFVLDDIRFSTEPCN